MSGHLLPREWLACAVRSAGITLQVLNTQLHDAVLSFMLLRSSYPSNAARSDARTGIAMDGRRAARAGIEFGHEVRLSAWQPRDTLKNYVAVVNRRSRGLGLSVPMARFGNVSCSHRFG